MYNKNYESFRKKVANAAERMDMEALSVASLEMESKILTSLHEQLNGFSMFEVPPIVAALDRYKSIVLNTAEQNGESREAVQNMADVLNEDIEITYTRVTRRVQLDGEH